MVAAAATTPISGLFARVYREILADRTQLPSMPDVAIRIRAAMQQPNYTVDTVARVVKADPGTSAYLLAVANSPMYAPVNPIQRVEHAISRLGAETTRNLVTAHALRAMFTTRSEVLAKVMRVTWARSAKLAALSAIIAERCRGFSPDQAMLAGLLQDIGVLPLLMALEKQKMKVPPPARIIASVEAFSSKVGAALLGHWGLEDNLVEVPRSKGDWLRNPSETPDLADIILIARLHTLVGTALIQTLPKMNEIPAFKKLNLGDVGPNESLEFVREAEEEVRALMGILGV
ncbi:MAG: HDOD domain-containing protein [Pseudomonadota bacterium]